MLTIAKRRELRKLQDRWLYGAREVIGRIRHRGAEPTFRGVDVAMIEVAICPPLEKPLKQSLEAMGPDAPE